MLFLNPLLLIGLLGILVPIVLHIFNRKAAKPMNWGAMRFLEESVASRTKRIELEDALLMAARCLIFGMLALALARPFSPPGSLIPWAAVLPLLLVGIAGFGVAFALWQNRKLRWIFLIGSLLILAAVGAAILFERQWNLRRLSGGGEQDVAIVIDASTSMGARFDDKTQFERAVDEAREIIRGSGRATAYSIILAGPSPVVLTGKPRTNRNELDQALEAARPSDGAMALPESLREASLQLSKGTRGSNRIILISDGQAHGWKADNPAAWDFASEGFGEQATNPQMILRWLDTPPSIRNITVTGVELDRDAVGTDRPVRIEVSLENTGTESVTPGGVQLRIGDQLLEDNSLGQLVPGLRQTVRFDHHFKTAGAHAVIATALVDDHVSADNSFAKALTVTGGMKVLIVDGNPGGRLFDRASAFLEIALAPGMAENVPMLLEPVVLPAPQIPSVTSFEEYGAVILADVQRLPASTAAQLAAYVQGGGGLLIAPGKRAEPDFYNQWLKADGRPLLPAGLVKTVAVALDATPVGPSIASFEHRSLRKAGDPKNGDLATARIAAYWQLRPAESDKEAAVIAKLNTGDPFIALRSSGSGSVVLTCLPMDNRASNIVARSSFLPLIHELVYYLTNPGGDSLNLPPAASLALRLASTATGSEPRFGVLDPRGDTRAAELTRDASGLLVEIPGDAMAGLYEMEIPVAAREGFTGLMTDAGTVPFTVSRPVEEASLTPLSTTELGFVSDYFEVLQPKETSEVLTILAGKSFGEELWKYLAIGALLLLLAEGALARWIARSRQTGADLDVDFETRKGPGKAFLKALGKLGKGAA